MKKVYFTCSARSEYIDFAKDRYDIIRKKIVQTGNGLIRDWFPSVYVWAKKVESRDGYAETPARAYKESIDAISNCDLFICEITKSTAALGFQIYHALQKKKPTLVLIDRDNAKHSLAFLSGCTDKNMKIFKYNSIQHLGEIVKNFLDTEISQEKIRMNFFLEKDMFDFIGQRADELGKTKTDILKEAIKMLN